MMSFLGRCIKDWSVDYQYDGFEFGQRMEFERNGYCHWAVYFGITAEIKNYVSRGVYTRFLRFLKEKGLQWVIHCLEPLVVHMSGNDNIFVSVFGSSIPPKSEDIKPGIMFNRLKDVTEGSKYRLFPRSIENDLILEKIMEYIHANPPYSLLTRNCEHVSNDIACDSAVSWQVVRAAGAAAIGIVGGLFAASQYIESRNGRSRERRY